MQLAVDNVPPPPLNQPVAWRNNGMHLVSTSYSCMSRKGAILPHPPRPPGLSQLQKILSSDALHEPYTYNPDYARNYSPWVIYVKTYMYLYVVRAGYKWGLQVGNKFCHGGGGGDQSWQIKPTKILHMYLFFLLGLLWCAQYYRSPTKKVGGNDRHKLLIIKGDCPNYFWKD